ncbi:MAG: 4Fe-4S ferredoxin, partial [Terriglobia bacterium]
MGHLVGKDVYRKLGTKVDGLTVRAPWNETLHTILKELYSPEEAEVFIGMPYGFATLDRIARSTGHERVKLQGTLERLAE